MNAEKFRALEAEIAGASMLDEPALLARAAPLFLTSAGARARFALFCESHAFAEAAILLHHVALPAHGFQFGETPGAHGLASTWRKGDGHALPFQAATASLALLRAIAHAAARKIESDMQARCTLCGGLGWTLARDNAKQLCRHGA